MSLKTYSDSEFDVKIIVGNGQNTKEFKAHSTILSSRSLYFQRALSERWNNKEQDFYVFKNPNIYPYTFKIILDYIYKEKTKLRASAETCINLMAASDELELLDLAECAQEHLIKNHSSWLFSNLITSLNFACQHDHFYKLHDLDIEDIKSWSDNQFEAFKETISQCIPLIRYFHIPKSYIDKQIKQYRLDHKTPYSSKTSNSFIFSFTNPSNPILSGVTNRTNNAIWSDKYHGPGFETLDLHMNLNYWRYNHTNYFYGKTNTVQPTVDEYEVFAVDNFNQRTSNFLIVLLLKIWKVALGIVVNEATPLLFV
ncbi:11537_t:CDS:2 [Dentiscutata heterogama]|uniref:11537_t:CDS:1 n=1 Tax=Dentiscutata heterogama TaxID=1316150 RepID=A0ACA9JV97_9GLOM|nr:11537_t:CDS:2 [Dentiscutata heterogama]